MTVPYSISFSFSFSFCPFCSTAGEAKEVGESVLFEKESLLGVNGLILGPLEFCVGDGVMKSFDDVLVVVGGSRGRGDCGCMCPLWVLGTGGSGRGGGRIGLGIVSGMFGGSTRGSTG